MRKLLALFRLLPPELAHSTALNSLKVLHKLKLIGLFFPCKFSYTPFYFKGLEFKNKLGVAAGLDKNGDFIESQAFSYLSVRTLLNFPISFPTTTNCKNPTIGGTINKNF